MTATVAAHLPRRSGLAPEARVAPLKSNGHLIHHRITVSILHSCPFSAPSVTRLVDDGAFTRPETHSHAPNFPISAYILVYAGCARRCLALMDCLVLRRE